MAPDVGDWPDQSFAVCGEIHPRDPPVLWIREPFNNSIPLQTQQHLGDRGGIDTQRFGQLGLSDPLLDGQPVDDMLLADVHADLVECGSDQIAMRAADLHEQQPQALLNALRRGRYLVDQLSKNSAVGGARQEVREHRNKNGANTGNFRPGMCP